MADATGTEPDEWELWRTFLKAQARLDRRIDSQLQRDASMTQGEYGALAAIAESGAGRLRVGEIAKALGWEKSRASHLVTRLVNRGWLVREPGGSDRRAADISVTTTGRRAYLAAIRGHAAEVHAAFLDNVPRDDRDVLMRVLRRIVDANP